MDSNCVYVSSPAAGADLVSAVERGFQTLPQLGHYETFHHRGPGEPPDWSITVAGRGYTSAKPFCGFSLFTPPPQHVWGSLCSTGALLLFVGNVW